MSSEITVTTKMVDVISNLEKIRDLKVYECYEFHAEDLPEIVCLKDRIDNLSLPKG